MNPYSRALVEFHSGNREATFTISRDDGYMQVVPASLFFDPGHISALEARALDLCCGKVLDIGSGAGRHSLELMDRGVEVTSLEILPELRGIMEDRGLVDIVIGDAFQFAEGRYDTLLMLMNGIGMTGNLEGLRRFLDHAHAMIKPDGQILCDSMDVSVSTNLKHVAYRERNLELGYPAGQQCFTMECKGEEPVRFEWLHLHFEALAEVGAETGWDAEVIEVDEDGCYLCRLCEAGSQATARLC